jgi:hypothetical protein
MKTLIWLATVLATSTLGAPAQDAKGAKVLMESHGPKAAAPEQKKVPVTPPQATNVILGKQVVYGGYLSELKRAEKKRAFFDLRAPVDYRKDLENVSFYPGTEKVQGIILFSVKF